METPIMLYALEPCAEQLAAQIQALFPNDEIEIDAVERPPDCGRFPARFTEIWATR